MKLIFLSDQLLSDTKEIGERMFELTAINSPKIGYLSSCPDPNQEFYQDRAKYYSLFGATLTPYVDLEEGYDEQIIEEVLQSDMIHLSGGNTFRFLYWIKKRKMGQYLIDFVKQGGILTGVSAGSIIMTPNIQSSFWCGDENEIGLTDMRGLDLVNFQYLPHWKVSDKMHQKVTEYSKKYSSSIVLSKDCDGIIINGNDLEVFGSPELVCKGKKVKLKHNKSLHKDFFPAVRTSL